MQGGPVELQRQRREIFCRQLPARKTWAQLVKEAHHTKTNYPILNEWFQICRSVTNRTIIQNLKANCRNIFLWSAPMASVALPLEECNYFLGIFVQNCSVALHLNNDVHLANSVTDISYVVQIFWEKSLVECQSVCLWPIQDIVLHSCIRQTCALKMLLLFYGLHQDFGDRK